MLPQKPLALQQSPKTDPVHVYPSGVPPLPLVPQWPMGEMGAPDGGATTLEDDELELLSVIEGNDSDGSDIDEVEGMSPVSELVGE